MAVASDLVPDRVLEEVSACVTKCRSADPSRQCNPCERKTHRSGSLRLHHRLNGSCSHAGIRSHQLLPQNLPSVCYSSIIWDQVMNVAPESSMLHLQSSRDHGRAGKPLSVIAYSPRMPLPGKTVMLKVLTLPPSTTLPGKIVEAIKN